jgi:DNA mismatch repair ATPase MutS
MDNTKLTKETTSEIETQLKNTDPDGMTPKEALDLIYKLKEMILN